MNILRRTIVAVLLLVAAANILQAQTQGSRQGVWIGDAQGQRAFERLHAALADRHQVEMLRITHDGDLRNEMRSWANSVRQAPCDWVLMYVQASALTRNNDGGTITLDDDGKHRLSLADCLARLAQASAGSPALLVVETDKNEVRQADLATQLQSAKAKGPLAAIVLKGDAAGRAFRRYLSGGEVRTRADFVSLRMGGLLKLVEQQHARQVVTASTTDDSWKTVLVTHRPRTLDEMLAVLAEEVAENVDSQALVIVPDARSSGEALPLLERAAAAQFRAALAESGVRVLAESQMHDLYAQLAGDNSPTALAKQAAQLDRSSVVVQLHLTPGAEGGDIAVKCEVHHSSKENTEPQVLEGLAILTPTEWAMKGGSVVTKEGRKAVRLPRVKPAALPPDSLPTLSTIDFARPASVARVLEATRELEQSSRVETHPLVDPEFPYRVQLYVNGKPAPARFSADKKRQYVSVEKGQAYTIRVQNRSQNPVFLRLLVDGLNSLPDRPLTYEQKDGNSLLEVAAKDEQSTLVAAPYALLHNARCWYCEKGEYEVRGFFTEIGAPSAQSVSTLVRGKRAEFVVTDASLSEASLRGHTKDVGIITAAVFSAVDDPLLRKSIGPRFGTRLGNVAAENVELYTQNLVPGELLAVIHLHYGYEPDR